MSKKLFLVINFSYGKVTKNRSCTSEMQTAEFQVQVKFNSGYK